MRFRSVRLGAATSKSRDLGGVTRKFLAPTVWDASRRRTASLPCLAGWGYCAGSARGCCRVVLRGQNDVTPARYQRITSERLTRKYEIGEVSQHVECAAARRLRKGARSGRLSSPAQWHLVRAPGQGTGSVRRVRKRKCAAASVDVAAHFIGGSGGIRTHGTGLPHNGFQDRLLRPLGHASLGSTPVEPGLPSAS